jgi:uncharacterized protein
MLSRQSSGELRAVRLEPMPHATIPRATRADRARRPRLPGLIRGRRLALASLVPLLLLLAPLHAEAEEGRRGVKQVRSFLELRHDKVVRQRWDLSCGAAALATILAYQHGDPVPEASIAKAMLVETQSELVRARLGFSLLDLKRYVEGRGYIGTGYADVTIDDLVDLAPAIVPVRFSTYDHFLVFRGLLGRQVVLADPAYGNRIMSVTAFEKAWQKDMAFVVERRDDAAPPDRLTARPDDFRIVPGAKLRTILN